MDKNIIKNGAAYSVSGTDTKDIILDIIDKTTTQDVLNWFDSVLASEPSLAVYGDIDSSAYSYESLNETWHYICNNNSGGFLN